MKETISPVTLEKTVRSLCRMISDQIFFPIPQSMSEEDLRCELICCLLSSQVPFESARVAAINIRSHGLLTDAYWHAYLPDLEVRLQELLSTPINVGGRVCKYRFPVVRAKQIYQTRNELYKRKMNLSDIVFRKRNMKRLRRELIFMVCGFGPKQASMFLRNIGCTYDLAILDRHVLRYMVMQGLISPLRTDSISLTQYESIEFAMENYAILLGYSIGYVDLAIWIAMRAAGG